MRVVGLMSGSGSNLRKIIEFEKHFDRNFALSGGSPYTVVAVFSDEHTSRASVIGAEYQLPVIVRSIGEFYAERGRPRRDLSVRQEFDAGTVEALRPYGAHVAAYAGYMSIATEPLINAFLGVNVHPADLSIMEDGRRKYTGNHAVRDAILAGERFLRSTTHIIKPEVDSGHILMVSSPLEVCLEDGFDPHDLEQIWRVTARHQEQLKEAADWKIFPLTLLHLAMGRYAQDRDGALYFEGSPIPQGMRPDNASGELL